jgi:hypothetical protein
MWLDKKDDQGGPPAKYLGDPTKFVGSFTAQNPTLQHKVWNFAQVKQMWQHPALSKWSRFFDEIFWHIEKCDFSRYAILYLYGGIYADLDITAVRPFDDGLLSRSFSWTLDVGESEIWNGFLASAPGHPVWADLMDYVMYNYPPSAKDSNVYNTTGPAALGKFARRSHLTIDERPDLYIDNCLVYLPLANRKCMLAASADGTKPRRQAKFEQAFGLFAGGNKCEKEPCKDIQPYVTTDHAAGSGWQASPAYLARTIDVQVLRPWAAFWVLLLLFLIVLIAFLVSLKRKEQCALACAVPLEDDIDKIKLPFNDSIVMTDTVFGTGVGGV